MSIRSVARLATLVAFALALPGGFADAEDVPPEGSPAATTTDRSAPHSQSAGHVRRRHQLSMHQTSTPYWQPQVVPPEGAPNILLVLIDDEGFGAPSTFGGVIPTPELDRIAERRPALHAVSHHVALLADACRAHHGQEPSLGRLRRHQRSVHRLSRLRQHHHQGQGDDRPDPQGERLCHVLVRQKPQHAGIRDQPGRSLRPMAERHGLRVFLRLQQRRDQSVAA